MPNNKIIWGNTVLIDLTADTVKPDKILASYTAHDASGAIITGTCDWDSNTKDATVKVGEILNGKTAYAGGKKITGTMPNRGQMSLTLDTVDGTVTIPNGYHDGSGTVTISAIEQAKLIANNIRQGIEILGVTGTLNPLTEVRVQALTVTPKITAQTVIPDKDHDYLTQVTVNAIPYLEVDNAQGGKTITIAGA